MRPDRHVHPLASKRAGDAMTGGKTMVGRLLVATHDGHKVCVLAKTPSGEAAAKHLPEGDYNIYVQAGPVVGDAIEVGRLLDLIDEIVEFGVAPDVSAVVRLATEDARNALGTPSGNTHSTTTARG